MPDLKDLASRREDILLAEVAAWLHDVGKLSREFIEQHSSSPPSALRGWHHELILQRRIREIEKKIGKKFTKISKDELRDWIKNKFGIPIPSNKGNRPFPNPKNDDFPLKLDSYLKKDPKSGTDPIIDQIREFFRITYLERKVAENFVTEDFCNFCEAQQFQILNSQAKISEVIEGHGDPINSQNLLVKLLKPPSCDAIDSALDKGMAEKPQELGNAFIASAFGYEYKIIADKLNNFRFCLPTSFGKLRLLLPYILGKALGETRRSANDVTLTDHSSSVAALYKSLLVRILLTEPQIPDISRFLDSQSRWVEHAWRLLSIRTNGIDYMLSAPSIPDLLARKDLLTDAWNRVQKVTEETYPLGLEVYRDENGPVFVVPDLDNLLGLSNSADNHKTLREYILEAFRQGTVKNDACLAIGGEVVPQFELSRAWSGQKDPGTGRLDLPPIGEMVAEDKTPPLQSDPEAVAQSWCHLPKPEEVCTVCGLRPQGPGKKAKDRKMCDVCEERRADRAKAWAEGASLPSEDRFKRGKPDTIWLDEVADKNRRLALIVGAFDLRHWLDGSLVRSLAVRTPGNQNGHTEEQVAKNPSFARLRRIWETTRRFWQDVAPTDTPPKDLETFCQNHGLNLQALWEGPLSLEASLAGQAIGEKRSRLFLKGTLESGNLGPFHAYEMMVQGRKVAVLWVPPDAPNKTGKPLPYRGGFWVLENLEYLAGENAFGRPLKEIFQTNRAYEIYEPSEYGKPGEATAQFTLEEQPEEIKESYIPLIPILAEPRTFMALVPADKAVDVVLAIKAKYEREMGKVRNRLPLHLGIVFADSHTPLRAVLDAGRRMLEQQATTTGWKVKDVRKQPNNGGTLPQRFKGDATGQFAKWYEVDIEKDGHKITWYIPAVMGDRKTKDNWYPYVFWQQDKGGQTDPSNATKPRTRYYQSPNPFDLDQNGNPRPGWLVHAGELREGDTIYFTPATLDFQWLDSSGRRFEIAYDGQGQRYGSLNRRPYLLDELKVLVNIWKTLSEHLTTSQIHALVSLVETRREEWQASPQDDTFRTFCHDALANAEWTKKPWETPGKTRDSWLKEWTDYAACGWLTDAVELFYHIMKQRPEEEA